ncbi:hypothetical protein CHU98_g7042 [Xylaria longipes]|nr:hypothetical protein CHU98_g7042 [Xylaria longipes]
MSGPRPKFKAEDALFRSPPKKQRRQRIIHMAPNYDPLAALDDDVPRPDIAVKEGTLSMNARRRVDEWLDHNDFNMADPTQPGPQDSQLNTIDFMNASLDSSEVDEEERIGLNTLDIVSKVLSQPPEDPEPTAEPAALAVPLTESAVKIIEAAHQREAAELDDQDEYHYVASETQTLHAGASHLGDETHVMTHYPKPHTLSAFHTMLAIWENEHSITRDAHTQLVEIFQLAKSLEEIQQTSRRQETSMKHVVRSLPLRKIRKLPLKLDYTTLPTRTKLEEDLLIFDMSDIVISILSSPDMHRHIYRGMAHLTNAHVENPWQANWWGESIRSTSGQFFYYQDGNPIFPSDFIKWKCPGEQCAGGSLPCETHFGRVRYCGWDFRVTGFDNTAAVNTHIPILLVQKVMDRGCLREDMATDIQTTVFSQRTIGCTELIIVEDDEVSLSPKDIISHIPEVIIDYYYDPSTPVRPGPLTSPYAVRLVYNKSRRQYRVVKLSSPHRAELELRTYGRQHFIDNFAGKEMISLPFQMFLDAFGLYRNMYVSLTGIYLTPEFFTTELRSRRSNTFPLTLGPHGSDLADVLTGLFHIRNLDSGVELALNNNTHVFVCSFVNCITGDMPSQQKLSGCLGPTATLPCRNCFVKGEDKANLHFDIVNQGRYHMQTEIDRRKVEQRAKSQRQEETLLRELGLHNNKHLLHTLEKLFPALDMIRSRPIDAAHSEYQGLSRLLHNFMFKDQMSILTPTAITEACAVYQSFTVPPRWGRLQSPKKHLDSWRMQELARGSIILPVLLRCWLQVGHIRDDCRRIIPRIAHDYFTSDDFLVPTDKFTAADWVISASWCFAQSVLAIFGRHNNINSSTHTQQISRIIISGRKAIQFLCQVNANVHRERAVTRNANNAKRTQKARDGRSATSHAPSYISATSEASCETEYMDTDNAASVGPRPKRRAHPQDRAQSFISMKGLPNIHTGLHLGDVIREYGSCRLVWTLLGEDKHRQYKSDITGTNHRNPAATLTTHENVSQTLRFLMEGSFETCAPDLHEMFQAVKTKCPNLTNTIVPHLQVYQNEDYKTEDGMALQGDVRHKYPLAQGQFSYGKVKEREDPMLNVVKLRDVDHNSTFVKELLSAHSRDYHNHSVILSAHTLTWWRRVSYTDKHSKRICFTVGSFIKLSAPNTENFTMARIDGLFIHERANSAWLFLVVSFTAKCYRHLEKDYLLQCPLYKMTGDVGIVGLSQVVSEYVWMVPGPGDSLLFIDYDISFM